VWDVVEAVVVDPPNFDVRVVKGLGPLDGGVDIWSSRSRVLFVVVPGFYEVVPVARVVRVALSLVKKTLLFKCPLALVMVHGFESNQKAMQVVSAVSQATFIFR
tara:strand:- start:72 stop:383 length:312 start_codon:yes stop_codon:yes gene_type:complete